MLTVEKIKSVLPALDFFFLIINRSILAKSGSSVTFRCLYNAVSLSRFTFCLNCKVDVAPVISGSVNDISSTLLVSGVL